VRHFGGRRIIPPTAILGHARNLLLGEPISVLCAPGSEGRTTETQSTQRSEGKEGCRVNETCSRIIGAAIEVHRELGPGFLEFAYEEALVIELTARSIPFERQVSMPVLYKGPIVANYRCDLIIDCKVVVELQATSGIDPIHMAQLLAYLKASGHQVGLLINFNVPILKTGIRRLLWDL